MQHFPRIETDRLTLSEVQEGDLPLVVEHLQDEEFSKYTSNIPYPYKREHAELWLKITREAFEQKKGFTFAIRDKKGMFIGAIGLHDEGSDKAELGYWMAKAFWNKGYITEAAKAVVKFGFDELGFNKIYATHFLHNPSSGKVMQKIGMELEAVLKQHLKKDGKYHDIPMYSIFKNEG
ncbi:MULTISPECIES: GNAT family N-acetyltransferase [Chryseobacterium]|uniref:Ribosomal-protein-alanine N-acetyltransferase n=1 Tax=Chryseobacterium camelliae TaxID=1265445 RepID=A0ABU0TQ04_9FLAO|nr:MULTISPECIES: GNAT family N-acetyltransferase [Chryseobacterium]MDT3407744.1 ribosomal-protein-alanine N-acetyltransferase [Pseudacidovorax intermedius]MDQ1098405.1 ribosomal-protein-alanine N-acetyltransferase [Chryseobacterium camelliae]MDQ1102328.1 ribosomal-protein-alanine N-acetyltransferase [Chryseobacterium sp. SORGH_AS_1048]MDR6085765.1 ribosomal-protein-alanine N-acetyltransferase [Chryseobacterium sp. SORGH_AS_0909]MDR6130130.1 ribosomal-protein-alanine N-acetyltransferase [Chryse